MRIKVKAKKFIFAAMAAVAISMPAVQMSAPLAVHAEEINGDLPDTNEGDTQGTNTDTDGGKEAENDFRVSTFVNPDEEDGEVHGTLVSDVSIAKAGDTVTFTVTPEEGYKLENGILFVTDASKPDEFYEATKTGENTFTVTMPADNITAEAYFVKVQDSYKVNTKVSTNSRDGKLHGKLKTDLADGMAKPGDTVTVIATPDVNYVLNSIFVYDRSGEEIGEEIGLRNIDENTFSFIMPSEEVDVVGVFLSDEELDSLIGNWANRKDYTNLMFLYHDTDGVYTVRIEKPISLNKIEQYDFKGVYDKELKRLGFDSSIKTIITYGENGDVADTVESKAPGGALINKDGIFFLNIEGDAEDKEPVQFEKIEGDYYTNISESENGNVIVDKNQPVHGEHVIVKTVPDLGFETQKVIVLDEDGKEVPVGKIGPNAYAFFMPKSDVTVSATFVASEAEEEPVDPGVENDSINGQSGTLVPSAAGNAINGYTTTGGNVVYSTAVKTGNANLLPLWIGLAAASAAVAVTLITVKKKRNN